MSGRPAFMKTILILAATLLIGLGTVETKDAFNLENARNMAHKEPHRAYSNQDIVSGIYDQLVDDKKYKTATTTPSGITTASSPPPVTTTKHRGTLPGTQVTVDGPIAGIHQDA